MYKTHGLSRTPHFDRWRHMMDRCYNMDSKAYNNYGGRGIKVDERWHNPQTFVEQLPKGYEPGMEIDRIDNDGNYEPGNVRWVTRQQNSANRRTARIIEHNGKAQSLTQWAKETGLERTVIVSRLDELGWPVERALTEPVADRTENMRYAQSKRWEGHQKKIKPEPRVLRRFMFRGQELTIRDISQITGIPIELLRKRICERGWSIEKATT